MNRRLLYSVPCANGQKHSPATIENFRAAREEDRAKARNYRRLARIHPAGSEKRAFYVACAKTANGLAVRWAASLPVLP